MTDQSELMIMTKLQAMVTLWQARGLGRDGMVLSTPPCESHSMHGVSTLDLNISEDGVDIVPDKAYSQE